MFIEYGIVRPESTSESAKGGLKNELQFNTQKEHHERREGR